jgi:sodium pump decarboxylase gamma subunit
MDMWTITIVGTGTVFITLIVLALILSQFSRVLGGVKKPAKAPAVAPGALAQPAAASAPKASGDPALIAVITAAIAAASGQSAASFRVASVEAAGGFNTPAWGHVDRLSRAVFGR